MNTSAAGARRGRARWPWAVVVLDTVVGVSGLVCIALKDDSLAADIANFIAFISMGVVGALILSRDRRNVIGALLLWTTSIVAIAFASNEWAGYVYERGSASLAAWIGWPGSSFWLIGFFPLLVYLPLLFPDGAVPSARWRPLAWTGLVMCLFAFVLVGFADAGVTVASPGPGGEDVELPNPLQIPALEPLSAVGEILWIGLLALFVLSVVAMVLRFRRSTGIERQQLRWFSFAAVFLVGYFILSSFLDAAGITEGILGEVISALGYLGLVAAIAVAILQYHLWDLDVVVKKTLVAGSLVVLAVLVYGGAVALIGAFAVDRNRPALLFAIALALGIAFRPAMRVGRRIADRLVYGTRATPYEVLTEFSERVGTSYATEDVLPRMAHVLGEGTGADVARIWLRAGATFRSAAVWPTGAGDVEPVAEGDGLVVAGETVSIVRDQGEVLGALSVRMPASDPMNPTREKLVRDLAAQAGLLLRNVRLVEDLRASRQRLVAAQDEERRRLERNIHDGAQQQLVALAVKARLAKQFADRDPAKAADMLGQIEADTQTTLEDLRDLARGIYPPLLADRGLVAAIEAQARKGQLGVSLDADGLGRFPAEIEATVYFCALEALQNVAKYADAAHTRIRLARANGTLSFEVVDDGRGFDPAVGTTGSGLQGMADRLAAVGGSLDVRSAPGGGTTVAGHVPVDGD